MSASRPAWMMLVLNLVAYVALIVVNLAAGLGWLGATNKELSEQYDTPLTPAGWAFSIWGLIFILQGIGVVYALLSHGYTASESPKLRVVNAISIYWMVGWAGEISWQLLFVQRTVVAMWLCLACLLVALGGFGMALRRIYALRDDFAVPSAALLYVAYVLPSAINTAWLSVASSLGVLVVARAHGIEADALAGPSILLAAAFTVAGTLVVMYKRDTAYALTLVWALMAVFGREARGGAPPPVRWASFACLTVMCVAAVGSVLRRRAPPPSSRDVRLVEPLKATVVQK